MSKLVCACMNRSTTSFSGGDWKEEDNYDS